MHDFFDSSDIAVASMKHGGDPQHWQKEGSVTFLR
jgi:hypothetical protein